jgi:hypothetical protein
MSPTMNALGALAKDLPFDPNDPEAVRYHLPGFLVPLVRALDAGRLHFDADEDCSSFYYLLATAMEFACKGEFGRRTTCTGRMQ